MSEPSSPPASPTYVTYQAYKSKRHSRNISNASLPLNRTPQVETVPLPKTPTRPTSNGNNFESLSPPPSSSIPALLLSPSSESILLPPPTLPTTVPEIHSRQQSSHSNGLLTVSSLEQSSNQHVASASSSASPTSPTPPTQKRGTTFRRIAHKSTASTSTNKPSQPSHLRTVSTPSSSPFQAPLNIASPQATPKPLPPPELLSSARAVPAQLPRVSSPSRLPSLPLPPIEFPTSPSPNVLSPSSSQQSRQSQTSIDKPTKSAPAMSAPYRAGFQPRGVYRPLTDEFLQTRRAKRDGDGEKRLQRVERTKLERRLEKLVDLHFPKDPPAKSSSSKRPSELKRPSSIFSLRSLTMEDASEFWRGVVSGKTHTEIRVAEQRITPWQEDASVSKCPLCLTQFHPLTNRKHHCRLCGQIICSLPIKYPQRPVLCSTLFVVDSVTRKIEEVGEGIDYGVRKKKASGSSKNGSQDEEDKFLKGVRLCNTCRPVLLKQQYYEEIHAIPSVVKLYERLIALEEEIEEALPKFQELILNLNHQEQPTKEASASRRRLLDSFVQYDKLSKRIRALPCPNGPGSSQDRVQMAILTRANAFLQKNMFPLQSLPTPGLPPRSGKQVGPENGAREPEVTNLDAILMQTLQPLLEQEALLENFIEEAKNQRKFEDVKSLKQNLVEIRREIEKVMPNP
ncbi:FYVE zinc finger-domain-containing protein [Panaeolus papilionaceus]|nr:FYVE zinc finger-domain-containing protein [Panaeolus papilionaceus]